MSCGFVFYVYPVTDFFLVPSGTFFIDPFSFFPDVDCCIHIPVHPISTSTNIHSIRQCQFLFLMSAYTADLAGCKITVYFYKMFSAFFQLVSQHGRNCPYPLSCAFPKMQASRTYYFEFRSSTHTIISFNKLPAEACWKSFLWFFIFS